MHKILNTTTLILCLTAASQCFADRVRNGGRAVLCVDDLSYQSLDYVVAKRLPELKGVELVPVSSAADSFRRIALLLDEKFPLWATSFREFVDEIGNENPKRTYIWNPVFGGLFDTGDGFGGQIPNVCHLSGVVEVEQAIARSYLKVPIAPGAKVNFDYDRNILSSILRQSPLQFSFMLVHEWLWNFTNDPRQNSGIDYFLHSKLFDELSRKEVEDKFRKVIGEN